MLSSVCLDFRIPDLIHHQVHFIELAHLFEIIDFIRWILFCFIFGFKALAFLFLWEEPFSHHYDGYLNLVNMSFMCLAYCFKYRFSNLNYIYIKNLKKMVFMYHIMNFGKEIWPIWQMHLLLLRNQWNYQVDYDSIQCLPMVHLANEKVQHSKVFT